MEKTAQKSRYEKPEIIYQKKIEVLAAVCDSVWVPGTTCRTVKPTCNKLRV